MTAWHSKKGSDLEWKKGLTSFSMRLHDALPHDEAAHVLLRGDVLRHLKEKVREVCVCVNTAVRTHEG